MLLQALLAFSFLAHHPANPLIEGPIEQSTKAWRCDGDVECARGAETGKCEYRDKTAYAEDAAGAVESLRGLCEAGYNVGPGGWTCKPTTLACEPR